MDEIADYLHDWYWCGYDCDKSTEQLGIVIGIVVALIIVTKVFCRLVRTEDKPEEARSDHE